MRNRHLWLRISEAAFPEGFDEKLKSEFSWSSDDIHQATQEYRRFVYLSQVADHPVSPPREVDLVWHVHLLFSKNYWDVWGKMLTRPLHHEPANSPQDEKKFRAQYGDTRVLYLQEFESFEFEKLWPSIEVLIRRERAGIFVLVCFLVAFVSIIAAAFTENVVFMVSAALGAAGFIVGLFFAASKNGGGSFGVSVGGDGGGCGD